MTKTLALGLSVDMAQVRAELQKLGSEIQNFFKGIGTSGGLQKEVQQGTGLFDAYGKEIKNVADTMKSELAPATEKVGKASRGLYGDILNLRGGIKGFITDMEMMIKVQMRWYAARTILFAIPQTLAAGIEFKAEINKAEAMLLRYSAMEGEVTNIHRQNVEEIITLVRKLAVTLPVEFGEIVKSADRLRAAGVDIETVKASLEDFAKLQVSFPEIQMNEFTTAIIGFLNTFRKSPGLRELDNDAARLKVILDKITMALAVGVIEPQNINVVIQHLGQMSQAAGFSMDQMLALSVMVTNLGSRAGVAGRALRGLIDSLATPAGLKNLEKIGIQLDKSKTIASQFKDIIEGLRKAMGTGEGGLTLGAMEFLRGIAPTQRRPVLIALIRELETYDEILNKISGSQGALDRTSQVMTETLSGQWIIIKNLTKELGAMFFNSETLGTGLKGLIEILKALGWVMSGLYGVIGLFTEGLKGLYYNVRSLTDPLMGLLLALKQVATGDTRAALETLKSIPKAFSENQGKSYDILMGAPEKIGKEVVKIQEILYGGVPKYKGGKDDLSKTLADALKDFNMPGGDKAGKAKSYASELLQYHNQYWNAVLAMDRDNYNLQQHLLDNAHKLGLVSDQNYYDKTLEIAEKAEIKSQVDIISKRAQLEADISQKRKDILRNPKSTPEAIEALEEEYDAKSKVIDEQENRIKNLITSKVDDRNTAVTALDRKNLLEQMNFELDIAGMTTEQRLAIVQDGYKKEESLIKWLYDNQAMDAKTYYTKLEDLANNELTVNKKFLFKKLNDFIAEKDAEIAYLRSQGVIDENQYITLNEAKTKYQLQINGEIVKSEQDTADKRIQIHREAADSIEYIWQTLGTKGILGKVFQDIKKEWGGIWQSMYDTLKEIFQDLKSNISDVFFDAMQGKTKSWYDYFMSLLSAIERRLADMAAQWIVGGNTGSGGLFGLISSALGLADSGIPAGLGGGIPGSGWNYLIDMPMASGGSVYPWGTYPVGERGVELFKPATSGKIIPNSQIGNSQPTVVNHFHFNVNAMDAGSFEGFLYRYRKVLGNVILAAGADNHRVRRQ
jgi:TP901 family phage tail tape measure protein